ncbi:MAG: lytic transglycosylase domain-containing protein [Gammaproteobacteria bacterium]|nr:lytic transglycosylase domain-containing protein [Gammaproteobacteria bacterium]MCW8972228.1 lytic transglycosylase domain-containing protein [Gammaproteobacteria bacterium]MCW8993729.1 lytic transglycosylase domain-containing protein [Gammaproteobacteria bacterium]
MTLRHLPLLISLLLLSGTCSAAKQDVDPELKQRLIAALAQNEGFGDRFDAEVWLLDMSSRLARVMPDEHQRLELLRHLHLEASRAGLPSELVLAVIQVESNFDRFAISSAGAQGLMQVMPFWLKELGRPDDNLFNVQTNLRFGCTILRYYLDMEKGNRTRALARYNGSLGSFRYPNLVYAALRSKWFR